MNAETAGVAPEAMAQAFAEGLNRAYWLATAFAFLGILVAAAIDEKRLQPAGE